MPVDVERAKERLLEERERVERRIASRQNEADESEPTNDDGGPDEHERSDVARSIVESEQQQALVESLRANLEEIDAALRRIDAGTYGIDEETGQPIDAARLEVFPTARTNVS